jgi:hypothetical protein
MLEPQSSLAHVVANAQQVVDFGEVACSSSVPPCPRLLGPIDQPAAPSIRGTVGEGAEQCLPNPGLVLTG